MENGIIRNVTFAEECSIIKSNSKSATTSLHFSSKKISLGKLPVSISGLLQSPKLSVSIPIISTTCSSAKKYKSPNGRSISTDALTSPISPKSCLKKSSRRSNSTGDVDHIIMDVDSFGWTPGARAKYERECPLFIHCTKGETDTSITDNHIPSPLLSDSDKSFEAANSSRTTLGSPSSPIASYGWITSPPFNLKLSPHSKSQYLAGSLT